MSNADQLIHKILKDIRVEATEEFDKNFERKGFFEPNTWQQTKHPNKRGSLMLRTSNLRRSVRSQIQGNSIIFTSNTPYADIHNNGGEIKKTVTIKEYSRKKAVKNKGKKGVITVKSHNRKMNITIPQRQFIGDHPQLQKAIEGIITQDLGQYFKDYLNNVLKKK